MSDTEAWRTSFRRFAPLVDAVEYFPAVRQAIAAARRQVLVLGWDIHSEIDLVRGDAAADLDDGLPVRFADLLQHVVEERDQLEVKLLIWEGASVFALERQHLPRMKRPWDRHPRIQLRWDSDTPRLASHHQKIVVVDDRVAFAGGMDLTKSRWDSHEHRIDDPRRRLPGLWPAYGGPYHDVSAVIDGRAAAVLGAWCRERWRRAVGATLDAPEPDADAADPWPGDVDPLFTDGTVSIAITQPEYGGRPEIAQVERLFVEQIRSAKQTILIESQYFSTPTVTDALAARLREPDGPEIILILPHSTPGTLQQMTMDTDRDRRLEALREADVHDRLRVYWPTLDGEDARDDPKNRSVFVHAKTMVIDDRILRIGSANLARRSMGLDTELDLTIDLDEPDDRIRHYRRRLLSYLLHVDPDAIAAAEERTDGLIGAVEHLRGGDRTLLPFNHRAPDLVHRAPLDSTLADPRRPLGDADVERVLKAIADTTRIRDRLRTALNAIAGAARRLWARLRGVRTPDRSA